MILSRCGGPDKGRDGWRAIVSAAAAKTTAPATKTRLTFLLAESSDNAEARRFLETNADLRPPFIDNLKELCNA